MIDSRTPVLDLPLPHPDNTLEDDVIRIRALVNQLDTAIGIIQSLLSSDDISLDSIQEVVNTLKEAQGDIGDVTTILATKATTTALAAAIADYNAKIEALDLEATQAVAALQAATPGLAPVQSVFGRTGAVTLTAADIAAALGFKPASPGRAYFKKG